jgi:hypothetical protein
MFGRNQGFPSWLILIFFLTFGFSAVSIVTTPLMLFLGLPFIWSTCLMLPILGGVFWLFYRGYSIKGWLLFGCAMVFALAGLALANGALASEPDIPDDIPDRFLEAREDEGGFPFYDYSYYEDYYSYDNVLETDEDEVLVLESFESDRAEISVRYPAFQSLDGQWSFFSGRVQARGAINGTFQVAPYLNWSPYEADSMTFAATPDSRPRTFQPYMVFELPVGQSRGDEAINLTATLEIVYPVPGEGASPDDLLLESETFTREVTIYVASDNFYAYREQYLEYRRARRLVENPIGLAGLSGAMVISGIAGLFLISRGAMTERGGFTLAVRQLSGVQRLGVEAYTLANLANADAQAVEHGVFLGFVNAQSPAGRGGLQAGDILTHFAGKAIHSPNELDRAAGRIQKGEVAQVRAIREGQPVDLFIKF